MALVLPLHEVKEELTFEHEEEVKERASRLHREVSLGSSRD